MDLKLDTRLADGYHNPAQRMRILSEDWVDKQVFCPHCGEVKIEKYGNNRPVADFYCANCREEFELKSKRGEVGGKVVDGAYKTMLERLASSSNPNFFFMRYNLPSLEVISFLSFRSISLSQLLLRSVIPWPQPLVALAG